MNILNSFCKNIFNAQELFIITLNGNESKIRQTEDNKFVIENMISGEIIDVDKCEDINCGFAIVSFIHEGQGYDLMVGEIRTLNNIALLAKINASN